MARDHGRAREETKTVERKEGVLFYRMGREPGTGEGGTATGMAAGGHGWWPRKARPFPTIGGAIQGGNWGELTKEPTTHAEP